MRTLSLVVVVALIGLGRAAAPKSPQPLKDYACIQPDCTEEPCDGKADCSNVSPQDPSYETEPVNTACKEDCSYADSPQDPIYIENEIPGFDKAEPSSPQDPKYDQPGSSPASSYDKVEPSYTPSPQEPKYDQTGPSYTVEPEIVSPRSEYEFVPFPQSRYRESDTVYTKSDSAKTEPKYVKLDTTYISSDPAYVKPDYFKPEASYVEPEPSYVKPEPSYVKPEPSYVKPEPSYVKPEPSYVKPDYVTPEPSYIKPEPSYVKPEPSYVKPETSYEPSYVKPETSYEPSYVKPETSYEPSYVKHESTYDSPISYTGPVSEPVSLKSNSRRSAAHAMCSSEFYHRQGKCGGFDHGYLRCQQGFFCSEHGFCGQGPEYEKNAVCPAETRADPEPMLYRAAPNDHGTALEDDDYEFDTYLSANDPTEPSVDPYGPSDESYKPQPQVAVVKSGGSGRSAQSGAVRDRRLTRYPVTQAASGSDRRSARYTDSGRYDSGRAVRPIYGSGASMPTHNPDSHRKDDLYCRRYKCSSSGPKTVYVQDSKVYQAEKQKSKKKSFWSSLFGCCGGKQDKQPKNKKEKESCGKKESCAQKCFHRSCY